MLRADYAGFVLARAVPIKAALVEFFLELGNAALIRVRKVELLSSHRLALEFVQLLELAEHVALSPGERVAVHLGATHRLVD